MKVAPLAMVSLTSVLLASPMNSSPVETSSLVSAGRVADVVTVCVPITVKSFAVPALAAAILFFENASGGGTDIVAMIIKKYSTMNISGALFVVDCVIVVVSFMVFDLTTGLCSVLGLMAKTLMIDKSIERMKLNKYFTIISSKPDEICEFIMNGLERSATVYHGEGVYSHKDKKIILTVVDVRQAVLLQRFIDEVDPQAFLMVTKSSEVVGKGFMSYI